MKLNRKTVFPIVRSKFWGIEEERSNVIVLDLEMLKNIYIKKRHKVVDGEGMKSMENDLLYDDFRLSSYRRILENPIS